MVECKKGQIMRNAYIKQNGTQVKANCIRSTSITGQKSADFYKPIIQRVLENERRAEIATSRTSPKDCPPGTIRRTAYERVTKSGKVINVPAACIKSQSNKEKAGLYNPRTGERVYVPIANNKLGEFGYHDIKNKNAADRHKSLERIVHHMNGNWLSLFRTLNYLAVVNKNNENMHERLIADRNFVKRKFATQ